MKRVFDVLLDKLNLAEKGEFVFYFCTSGLQSIFLILFLGIAKVHPADSSNVNQPVYMQICVCIFVATFMMVYVYSLQQLSRVNSLYANIKRLFIAYPPLIWYLLNLIFSEEQTVNTDKRWYIVGILIWLSCYIVTEVMFNIFKNKIFTSWKELEVKDKYTFLVPVITFILGYILK